MILSRAKAIKLNTTCLQLCCIYAVYMALIKSIPGMVLPFGLLVPAYFTAALLRKASRRALKPILLQWFGIGAGLIYTVVLLTFVTQTPPWEWLTTQNQFNFDSPLGIVTNNFDCITIGIIGLLLWHMGWRQTGKNIDFAAMFLEFQVGFGILFVVLVTTHGLKIEVAALPLIAGLFFALGLFGLMLSRENHTAADHKKMSQMRTIYSVLGMVLIFILAGLFMLLASPEAIEKMLHIGQLIRTWIWGLILGLMDFFLNLFPPKNIESTLGGYESIIKLALDNVVKNAKSSSTSMREILHIVYALFWAGVVLATLWRISVSFLDFLKKFKKAPHHVTYEAIPGAFKTDLSEWFRACGQAIKKMLRQIIEIFNHLLPLDIFFPGIIPTMPIAQKTYENMLRWAAKKGFARQPDQTPGEHGRQISDHTPETRAAIKIVTQFYGKHRYGDIALLPEDEHQLINAWHTLKKIKLHPENRRNPA